MALDLDALRGLLVAIDQTDIAELTLKSADFELTVRRGARLDGRLYAIESVGEGRESAPPLNRLTVAGSPSVSPAEFPAIAPPVTPTQPPASVKNDRRLVEISSPMVGTFYRAPAPDEPPFVNVGDRVQTGQTVCIVEAMKLMNEIEAEVSGEVVEILVQNGAPVEYGQPLMRVNPG